MEHVMTLYSVFSNRHSGDVGAGGSREGLGVGGLLPEAQEEQPVARGGLLGVQLALADTCSFL